MYLISGCSCEGGSLGLALDQEGYGYKPGVPQALVFGAPNAAASCTIQGSPLQEGGVDSAGTGPGWGGGMLTLLELGLLFIVPTQSALRQG